MQSMPFKIRNIYTKYDALATLCGQQCIPRSQRNRWQRYKSRHSAKGEIILSAFQTPATVCSTGRQQLCCLVSATYQRRVSWPPQLTLICMPKSPDAACVVLSFIYFNAIFVVLMVVQYIYTLTTYFVEYKSFVHPTLVCST